MTGRQEYDRTKDRQRTLDKYILKIEVQYIEVQYLSGTDGLTSQVSVRQEIPDKKL
jgi:hypothetical protein